MTALTPLPDQTSYQTANRAWRASEYGEFAKRLDIAAKREGLTDE